MAQSDSLTKQSVVHGQGFVWDRASWRSKWILVGVAVLCYALFTWAASRTGVARTHGFDGSLLVSHGTAGNLLVVAALALACVAVGTVLGAGVWPDAGLLGAAAGLLALSNLGRPVFAPLHDVNGSRGVFLPFSLELILLYAVLGVGAWVLYVLQRQGKLPTDMQRDGLIDVDLPAGAGVSALVSHAAVMALVVVLVAQSEDKKQVVAAVALGAFAGAFFPYWQPSARPSAWYWTGPLVVGLFGYLFAWIYPAPGVAIGRPAFGGGFLAALARPLPLDYAGVGTAAALIGYWFRRLSLYERQVMDAQSST